ncbi:hypothetical protein GCM10009623_22070 [Nocardioides aestuarii]
MSLDIVSCPECGLVAEVTRRDWLASTAGPVEHVHVRCVQRHWFVMPAEGVTCAEAEPSSAAARASDGRVLPAAEPGPRSEG